MPKLTRHPAHPELIEIAEEQFWHIVNVVPPLLRLGYSDGPGAFINSEPDELRRCTVHGVMDYTYTVAAVLENAAGEPQFFEHDGPLTLNEFMAFTKRIMPGIGICGMHWGSELLDENGNLWPDLEYPIRQELGSHPRRTSRNVANQQETP